MSSNSLSSPLPSTSTPQPSITDTFHLYSYFRSSCSARLRIALALKNITPTYTYIPLLESTQTSPSYTALNPSHSVPTLIITSTTTAAPTKIILTQSLPALEYLDEAYPQTYSLLPHLTNPTARAAVRTLCAILASDTQPPTNLRILKRVSALSPTDPNAAAIWAREIMTDGLRAYEEVCKGTAGLYSVGDEVTMADCCLVPALWGARRWGVDVDVFETVKGVVGRLEGVRAFRVASWRRQGDTPAEFREEGAVV